MRRKIDQADFEAGDRYSGILYGEQFRGILADRGQRTVIGDGGKVNVAGTVGDSKEIQSVMRVQRGTQILHLPPIPPESN